MDFQIAHSLPGRIRLRYERKSLSMRQAMLVQMLVSMQEELMELDQLADSYTTEHRSQSVAKLKAIADKLN